VSVTIVLVVLTLLVSVLAGGVGALLGVGGGAFLVPFLVLAGVPFRVAVGTSLIMIIATSSAVATGNVGRGLINLRLGMALEVATAAGGLAGGLTAQLLSTSTLQTLFAVVAATTVAVLDLLSETTELRDRLELNARTFRERMTAAGFDIPAGEHPIVPVMLGDEALAHRMADELLEEGVYVIGFSFPVVPKGAARIRVQLSAAHTDEQMNAAIEAFIKVGKRLGVIA